MHRLAAASFALAAWSFPALASVTPAVRRALGIRDRVPTDSGVALTFDDGPHPQATPLVLERLAAAEAVATFFLVGEQVERRPALAREIAAAGHRVGLHGHRHSVALRLGPRRVREDLRRGRSAVAAAT